MEKKSDGETQRKIEDLIADGRNKEKLICPRCPSTILNAQMAIYKETEVSMPNHSGALLLSIS